MGWQERRTNSPKLESENGDEGTILREDIKSKANIIAAALGWLAVTREFSGIDEAGAKRAIEDRNLPERHHPSGIE